jgi:nanoRNase/pAp phosphatase (c-di-AMP/oligoRNAs hydrolase)
MDDPGSTSQPLVTQQQLERLREAAGSGPVLILTHDNPDPDALSSGKTLATLFKEAWGISSRLVYSGLVGRAENKVMLLLLTPEWEQVDVVTDLEDYSAVALVDTQPGTGNNCLPSTHTATIVFDHHRKNSIGLQSIPFVDIRADIGATVSLVYLYLEAAGLEPDTDLANAIFYGIQTDTHGLSRGNYTIDQPIYFKLLRLIDREKLRLIEQAKLPREYFRALNNGLMAVRLFGQVLTAYLGEMHRPDFMADMADLLIRLENVRAVLCLGYHGEKMYLSMRTQSSDVEAGLLIQRVILTPGKGGGHGNTSGGQIRLDGWQPDDLARLLQERFITLLGESTDGDQLL